MGVVVFVFDYLLCHMVPDLEIETAYSLHIAIMISQITSHFDMMGICRLQELDAITLLSMTSTKFRLYVFLALFPSQTFLTFVLLLVWGFHQQPCGLTPPHSGLVFALALLFYTKLKDKCFHYHFHCGICIGRLIKYQFPHKRQLIENFQAREQIIIIYYMNCIFIVIYLVN